MNKYRRKKICSEIESSLLMIESGRRVYQRIWERKYHLVISFDRFFQTRPEINNLYRELDRLIGLIGVDR